MTLCLVNLPATTLLLCEGSDLSYFGFDFFFPYSSTIARAGATTAGEKIDQGRVHTRVNGGPSLRRMSG